MKNIKDKTDLYYRSELELQSICRTAGSVVLEHYIIQHRLRVGTNVIISKKLSVLSIKTLWSVMAGNFISSYTGRMGGWLK